MVFQWKPLACVKADPQAAGEQMKRLEETGHLTPKNLLDANREVGSPLHDDFEWDDNVAAEKYREDQAAYFIRQITVVEERPSKESVPVRAFVNIKVNDTRSYLSISRVLSDNELRANLLLKAKADMQVFKMKYESLEELSDVFRAMDEVIA